MKKFTRSLISCFVVVCFAVSTVFYSVPASAQTMPSIPVSSQGLLLNGMIVHPDNPLQFNFLFSQPDVSSDDLKIQDEALKQIRYFLASLAIPENDLWVNLSPYEPDRIVPNNLSKTEMGRDMLAQDYVLKQLTASLMSPESEQGKIFWDKIYQEAYEKFGVTNIPAETFNKVWIVPNKSSVFENNGRVYVLESSLKVMLEQDYVAKTASENRAFSADTKVKQDDNLQAELIRQVILPEIERQINEGEQFAQVRQIYHALLLATWFKKKLQKSLLGQLYVDQNKTSGIDLAGEKDKQKIYNDYLQAFQKGAFDTIKDEYDPSTQSIQPKKYFAGGLHLTGIADKEEIVGEDAFPAMLNTPSFNIAAHLMNLAHRTVGVFGLALFLILIFSVQSSASIQRKGSSSLAEFSSGINVSPDMTPVKKNPYGGGNPDPGHDARYYLDLLKDNSLSVDEAVNVMNNFLNTFYLNSSSGLVLSDDEKAEVVADLRALAKRLRMVGNRPKDKNDSYLRTAADYDDLADQILTEIDATKYGLKVKKSSGKEKKKFGTLWVDLDLDVAAWVKTGETEKIAAKAKGDRITHLNVVNTLIGIADNEDGSMDDREAAFGLLSRVAAKNSYEKIRDFLWKFLHPMPINSKHPFERKMPPAQLVTAAEKALGEVNRKTKDLSNLLDPEVGRWLLDSQTDQIIQKALKDESTVVAALIDFAKNTYQPMAARQLAIRTLPEVVTGPETYVSAIGFISPMIKIQIKGQPERPSYYDSALHSSAWDASKTLHKNAKFKGWKDKAMLGTNVQRDGGIDLKLQDFRIQQTGSGVEFNVDPAMLQNIKIDGLVPVIDGIERSINLRLILGLATDGTLPSPAQNPLPQLAVAIKP